MLNNEYLEEANNLKIKINQNKEDLEVLKERLQEGVELKKIYDEINILNFKKKILIAIEFLVAFCIIFSFINLSLIGGFISFLIFVLNGISCYKSNKKLKKAHKKLEKLNDGNNPLQSFMISNYLLSLPNYLVSIDQSVKRKEESIQKYEENLTSCLKTLELNIQNNSSKEIPETKQNTNKDEEIFIKEEALDVNKEELNNIESISLNLCPRHEKGPNLSTK